jgi:tetratricopeptide (TPR) repeat protein
MDPNRLKQVQQTDLTESRLNQEFIFWLKEKGPTWLLVVLVGLVAWIAVGRYQEYRSSKHSSAFFDLEKATDPEALESVAEDHQGVAAVSQLARLGAADRYLIEVDRRRDSTDIEETLDDAAINERLDKAEGLYRAVLDTAARDSGERLFAVQALFGLASVAEARGEFDEAADYYEQAADVAGEAYEPIAARARARKESVASLEDAPTLPAREDLPHPSPIDPLLRDLLTPPPADDETTSSTPD